MRDFFNPPDEQCVNTSAARAYLYDSEDGEPVALSEMILHGRPVVIENPTLQRIVFRPVDKILYGPRDKRRGDVFMHTKDRRQLYFVEMKLWRVSGWFKSGLEQLRNVVLDFLASHGEIVAEALIRRAYICNPYRPRFAFSHAEAIRDFHRETCFVLHPEGSVKVGLSQMKGAR